MDWTTFLFGALIGVLSTIVTFAIITWRGMRPYLKAARQRQADGASITPPLNWGTTANDPVSDLLRSAKRRR